MENWVKGKAARLEKQEKKLAEDKVKREEKKKAAAEAKKNAPAPIKGRGVRKGGAKRGVRKPAGGRGKKK